MFAIRFFQGENGKAPVKDYLKQLTKEALTNKNSRIKLDKIREYINTLETLGTRAGEPYTKHIEGDIWELRPISDRIFYFCYAGTSFVFVHYFHKKTQKTPQREIEQAKRNRDKYLKGVKK